MFSGDPALELPEDAEEKARVLKIARETGKWPIKPGETPTLFHIRQPSGLAQEFVGGEIKRRDLTPAEAMTLLFRFGVQKIENAGDLKVTYQKLGQFRILSDDTLNELFDVGKDIGQPDLGRSVVDEIGVAIFNRMQEPLSPL